MLLHLFKEPIDRELCRFVHGLTLRATNIVEHEFNLTINDVVVGVVNVELRVMPGADREGYIHTNYYDVIAMDITFGDPKNVDNTHVVFGNLDCRKMNGYVNL
jgi:hypothetical protein